MPGAKVKAGEARGGAESEEESESGEESEESGPAGTKPAGKMDEIVDKVRYKPSTPSLSSFLVKALASSSSLV